VRLRERKIGPYKYPTIDRTRGKRRPKKKKQSKDRVKKNRVKQSIQNLHRERNQLCCCLHPCRKINTHRNQYLRSRFRENRRKRRKSPTAFLTITRNRKHSNPHQYCSLLHHRQKRKAVEPHQHCSLLRNLQKQVRPFPFVFALLCSNCI